MEGEEGKPLRSGVHYFRYEGPNKTFYEGIIRALEGCLDLAARDDVSQLVICGDCQPVLRQLTGVWAVNELMPYLERVRNLEAGCATPVLYEYLSEDDARYRKVDQLSKRAKKLIQDLTAS